MENNLKPIYHNSFEDGLPCPTCKKHMDGRAWKIEGKDEIFCSRKCAELHLLKIKV
jgi:endogenous inhibitor of DNA gyrase (YacG/DUF329 family)